MSAVVRKAGHRLRVTTSGSIAGGDFAATATLVRSDDPEFTYSATWTMDRATRAGLASKDVWRKYGEAMCKARAISEVCREGAEDALMGIHYTPEELDAEVNEGGEAEIVVPAEEHSAPQPPTDWAGKVVAATTQQELIDIRAAAEAAGEYTDLLRTLLITRNGELKRAAEAVPEPAPEVEPEAETVEATVEPDDEPTEEELAAAREEVVVEEVQPDFMRDDAGWPVTEVKP